jgi:hypothetical protein
LTTATDLPLFKFASDFCLFTNCEDPKEPEAPRFSDIVVIEEGFVLEGWRDGSKVCAFMDNCLSNSSVRREDFRRIEGLEGVVLCCVLPLEWLSLLRFVDFGSRLRALSITF